VAWAVPVPESGTVCGLSGALSVIVIAPLRAPSWVGVNVTLITQLFPIATVLPQDFATMDWAKSPLVAMLLMFRTAVPELVSVTVFTGPVAPTTTLPHARAVGTSVTAGAGGALTVRFNVVVDVNVPDVPETVTLDVPVAAVALAVNVSVLFVDVGFGLNPADTPLGRPEALSVTLPLKPFTGTTVMVLVPFVPWITVSVLGAAPKLKFGGPTQPGKVKLPMAVLQLPPLLFSYSSVNQKVQSSVGSIVTEL